MIQQNINLISRLPQPPKYDLKAVAFFQIITVFCLLLLFIFLINLLRVFSLSHEYTVLQKELVYANEKLEETTRQYPALARQQEIQNEIDTLTQEIAQRKEALDISNAGQRVSGYSPYFKSLVIAATRGVWLTHIYISSDGKEIRLTGRTVDPLALPLFLKKLNKLTGYEGKEFKTFELREPKKSANEIAFLLSTTAVLNKEILEANGPGA